MPFCIPFLQQSHRLTMRHKWIVFKEIEVCYEERALDRGHAAHLHDLCQRIELFLFLALESGLCTRATVLDEKSLPILPYVIHRRIGCIQREYGGSRFFIKNGGSCGCRLPWSRKPGDQVRGLSKGSVEIDKHAAYADRSNVLTPCG